MCGRACHCIHLAHLHEWDFSIPPLPFSVDQPMEGLLRSVYSCLGFGICKVALQSVILCTPVSSLVLRYNPRLTKEMVNTLTNELKSQSR